MLCKSSDEATKKKLHLDSDIKYDYLNENYDRYEDFCDKDMMDYGEMIHCMDGLKISAQSQSDIFSITGGVLHLGQVKFQQKGDGSEIKKTENKHYKYCSDLFGISQEELFQLCCTRVINTPGKTERIVIEVDPEDAKVNRDT